MLLKLYAEYNNYLKIINTVYLRVIIIIEWLTIIVLEKTYFLIYLNWLNGTRTGSHDKIFLLFKDIQKCLLLIISMIK